MAESGTDTGIATGAATAPSLALRAARWALAAHRANFDGVDNNVVRVPDTAATELVRQVATEVQRLVQQIMPLSTATLPGSRALGPARRWRFERDQAGIVGLAHALSQSLVTLNCRVERVYLVPPSGLHADLVNRQIAEDGRIGISSRSLSLAGLDAEKVPVSLVWIMDEGSVMYQEPTEDGAPIWTVSGRDADVSRAETLWKTLWRQASEYVDAKSPQFLADPVLESAEQMAAIAPVACVDGYGGHRCSWYHGAWQYLRLFDMVSSPSWHEDFYRKQLLHLLNEHAHGDQQAGQSEAVRPEDFETAGNHPRVLITGTADYSMLAYVIEAWRRTEAAVAEGLPDPEIDVLDICPTPLLACRWYAKNIAKYPISTHEVDIRNESMVRRLLDDRGSYHVIATDAFLTRFDHLEAKQVLENWWKLLAPGGQVITTVRLHSEDLPGDGPDEVTEFAMRARESARRWKLQLRSSIDEICDDAREYARRITSTDFGGADEVKDLILGAGFDIIECPVSELVPGELRSTKYLRLVLRKPADAVV